MADLYVQQNQPPGVPPLALDRRAHAARRPRGELLVPPPPRRLRLDRRARHRGAGRRPGLRRGLRHRRARRGARCTVTGVDAQPRRPRARAPALPRGEPEVRARRGRDVQPGRATPSSFLQTIEHVQDPDMVLEHIRSMLAPGGVAYVSTPNVLTLAPKGAEKSGNPWHVKEYRAEEFRELCARALRLGRALRAVPRAQAARARAGDQGAAGTSCTALCASPSRSTTASRRRSRRATSRCAREKNLDRALDFLAVCRP